MIAKKFRFHGYGSLKFVYSKAKTVRSRYVSLKSAQNPRRSESRIAVVVSKKVAKRAPQRNRIRRRLYEALRQRFAMIEPGHDIVVTVFDGSVASIDAAEISKITDDLLKQAKLIK